MLSCLRRRTCGGNDPDKEAQTRLFSLRADAVTQLSAGGSAAVAEMEADFSVLAAPSAFVGERLSFSFGCA